MSANRVVKFQGPGEVVVEPIDYPKLEIPPDVAQWLGIGARRHHTRRS